MARDIYDAFRELCGDSRFDDVGAALRRAVVDGALSYEIALSAFEFDLDRRAEIEQFASSHGLEVADGRDGSLLLRQPV